MEEHPRLTALFWFGATAAIPILLLTILFWRALPPSYGAGALASVLLWAPILAGDIANPNAICGYKRAVVLGVLVTLLCIFSMGILGGLCTPGALNFNLIELFCSAWSLGLYTLLFFGIILIPYGALIGLFLRRRRKQLFENSVASVDSVRT